MTRLIAFGCRQLGQHQIAHLGVAHCCHLDYTEHPHFPPGSGWQTWYIAMLFRPDGPSPEQFPRWDLMPKQTPARATTHAAMSDHETEKVPA